MFLKRVTLEYVLADRRDARRGASGRELRR